LGKIRLKLYEHIGADIPEFELRWIEPRWQVYKNNLGGVFYNNLFKYRRVFLRGHPHNYSIDIKYYLQIPDFMFGHFMKDGILVKFDCVGNDVQKIHIWFFEGMRKEAETIFNQWVSGQFELD